jgi:hypothetical protein
MPSILEGIGKIVYSQKQSKKGIVYCLIVARAMAYDYKMKIIN